MVVVIVLSTRGNVVCAAVRPPLATLALILTAWLDDTAAADDEDDEDNDDGINEATDIDADTTLIKSLVGVELLGVTLLGAAVSCSSVISSRTVTRVPMEVTWGSITVAATRRLSPRRSNNSS